MKYVNVQKKKKFNFFFISTKIYEFVTQEDTTEQLF